MNDPEAIETVLSMPRELRVRLVERLLEGLVYPEDDFDVPQEVIEDCKQIIEAIDAGQMKTYSWEEVKTRLRARRHAGD